MKKPKYIRASQRRMKWAKFRWKWLKRNCPHFCRWCKYREVCDV